MKIEMMNNKEITIMKNKKFTSRIFILLVVLSAGSTLAEQSISEQSISEEMPEAHAVSMESNDLTFSQLSQKGITAYHNKNYIEAIGYYRQALNKRKDDVSTLNNLALALLKVDEPSKLDESIAVSNAVIAMAKKDSQKANAYFNKGNALEKKGENILALQSYRNAHELSPSPARLEAYNRMEAIAPKRYSGTDWSEGEIIKYLKKPSLKLAERGVYKYMTEACINMLPSIQSLDFSFIRPTIVVDDWDDIKLDPYRKKYKSFKYGMGYEMHSPDVLATIPTWNITIYNLDIDQDTKIETIMHGERTAIGTYERTYDPKHIMGQMRPKYRVFESDGSGPLRGADTQSDPQTLPNKRDKILSALVNVQDIVSVLVVEDVVWRGRHDKTINLYLLGKQTLQRGNRLNSQRCTYDY